MSAPPRFFDIHNDYSQLLSGAHRKPAAPIGSPALVCHLGLWQPNKERKNDDDPLEPVDVETWKNSIDNYLRYLFCLLLDYGVTSPNTDATEFYASRYLFLLGHALDLKSPTRELKTAAQLKLTAPYTDRYFDTAYQSIIFDFKWHYIPAKLRIERHVEYLQITCFLDLSSVPTINGQCVSSDELMKDEIYGLIYRNLRDLDNFLFHRHAAVLNPNNRYKKVDASADDKKKIQEIHASLYDRVWKEFISEILNSDRAINHTEHGIDIEGTVASQYKKISTGDSNIGAVFAYFCGLVLNEHHPDPLISNGSFLQLPGWHTEASRSSAQRVETITSQQAAELTYTLWPLLTIEERVDLKKYEFTVSRMLGNRAVYITALGAQPSPYLGSLVGGDNDRQLPVFYLAYFRTFNRWQIGRLIDRINQLGTVRIAAIQQSADLRDKSVALHSASEPIEQYLEEAGGGATRSKMNKLLKRVRDKQVDVAKWSRDFPGGIQYRIERSRYYAKQFKDDLPALRIRRVEGYQPYDVFVEHRLAATYDFIHRLGLRLERFDRRLSTVYQLSLVDKAAEHAHKISMLQLLAEILFVGLAAPYYLLGTLDYFVPSSLESSVWPRVCFALIWLGCGLYSGWRSLKYLRLKRLEPDED